VASQVSLGSLDIQAFLDTAESVVTLVFPAIPVIRVLVDLAVSLDILVRLDTLDSVESVDFQVIQESLATPAFPDSLDTVEFLVIRVFLDIQEFLVIQDLVVFLATLEFLATLVLVELADIRDIPVLVDILASLVTQVSVDTQGQA